MCSLPIFFGKRVQNTPLLAAVIERTWSPTGMRLTARIKFIDTFCHMIYGYVCDCAHV